MKKEEVGYWSVPENSVKSNISSASLLIQSIKAKNGAREAGPHCPPGERKKKHKSS
jgi:hypothetical protein